MIATASYDEMLRSTAVGRYHAGALSLSFIVDPSLVGVVVWGRPTAEQIVSLVEAHERMRPVLAPRTAALVDVRSLEWPAPSAFEALVGYLAARRDWLAEYIDRLAVVRPSEGPVGAAGAGFFDVSTRPFTVGAFTELPDALAWMGRSDAAAIAAELEALFAEASGTPGPLRLLRQQLDARPGSLSLQDAARALAVTERTLQRWLKSWRTTFQAEQNEAQVRAAKRLLRDGEVPLAAIASEVGCASLSHFSALFRRIAGETPSDWRKQHRGGG
ncbi:MAG: helix-turn-helix domain-containing protein [Polyangiaceae bacterium]